MVTLSSDVPAGVPVYQHIKDELKRLIDAEVLKSDEQVPSELELSRSLGISRSQARLALRDLEMEGYLIRRKGVGSFVAPSGKRVKHLGLTRFRVVAAAFPTIYSPYMRSIIEAIQDRLRQAGFRMLIYFTSEEASERAFLRELRNSGIEGLALWVHDRSEATQSVLRSFREAAFPFVLWDRYVPGCETDFVGTDNVEVGYRLTRSLIEKGHRRIGFVVVVTEITPAEERFEGYRRALKEAGIPFDEQLVAFPRVSHEFPGATVRDILAQSKRPTAFFCADETALVPLLPLLRELRYRFPEDMAFAAVDDANLLQGFGFPMALAFQRPEEMGRITAELLLERINNPSGPVARWFVPVDFVNVNEDDGKDLEELPKGGDVAVGDSGVTAIRNTTSWAWPEPLTLPRT